VYGTTYTLVRKLKFHERYPAFPGNLAMDKEGLMSVGNNDAGNFYEMCIEFLDYLEDIINLEAGVFESLGNMVPYGTVPSICYGRVPTAPCYLLFTCEMTPVDPCRIQMGSGPVQVSTRS